MKNKWILSGVLTAFIAFNASAVPITGGISTTGGYTPNNTDLTLATSFALSPIGVVTSVSGSFATVGILPFVTQVNWTPTLTFDPATPVSPLWFLSGGSGASFDLLSFFEVPGTVSDSLELRGTGLLHLNGFDNTVGTWIATFNSAGGTFSFSSSNAAVPGVPDGGLTVALLGGAFAGLGVLRRKLVR